VLLDHGGQEGPVSPNQLDCGIGMFTLLDAYGPGAKELVRLSSAPDFYFDPQQGEPAPASFVDDNSLESSRLFGQGAELRVAKTVVASHSTK
jgi:hypothetical protein